MKTLNKKDWENIYRMALRNFKEKSVEDRYFLCKCIIDAYNSVMVSKGYTLRKVGEKVD